MHIVCPKGYVYLPRTLARYFFHKKLLISNSQITKRFLLPPPFSFSLHLFFPLSLPPSVSVSLSFLPISLPPMCLLILYPNIKYHQYHMYECIKLIRPFRLRQNTAIIAPNFYYFMNLQIILKDVTFQNCMFISDKCAPISVRSTSLQTKYTK